MESQDFTKMKKQIRDYSLRTAPEFQMPKDEHKNYKIICGLLGGFSSVSAGLILFLAWKYIPFPLRIIIAPIGLVLLILGGYLIGEVIKTKKQTN